MDDLFTCHVVGWRKISPNWVGGKLYRWNDQFAKFPIFFWIYAWMEIFEKVSASFLATFSYMLWLMSRHPLDYSTIGYYIPFFISSKYKNGREMMSPLHFLQSTSTIVSNFLTVALDRNSKVPPWDRFVTGVKNCKMCVFW